MRLPRSLLLLPCLTFLLPAADLGAQEVLVKPYVQPGNGTTLDGTDVKVLCWLTEQKDGDFVVEYRINNGPVQSVRPVRIALDFEPAKTTPKKTDKETPKEKDGEAKKEDAKEPKVETAPLPAEKQQHYFKYTSPLAGLPFDSEISYRVKQGDRIIRESNFRTRASAGKPVRFALVGDMATGKEAQNAIAYQISRTNPDFLVALGDIVYPTGRVSQYMGYFWKTYNHAEQPSVKMGAPLMASVPIYPVVGNHDVGAKLPAIPDALGAYYFFDVPRNGPGEGPWNTPLGTDKTAAQKFRATAGAAYPALDAYSFDNGPVHILVLNVNRATTHVDSPEWRQWIEKDLKTSQARWKIVCFHQPAFHTSKQHYTEQAMRLLEPLFEQGGVDLVFSGHVHNYQRSLPLRFAPNPAKRDSKGRVNGVFTLDTHFDGDKHTRPDGVIHIVSGGGGASLYGPAGLDKIVESLKKDHGDNWAPFNAKYVADRYSFTTVEATPERLLLRAIDLKGEEFDRIVITKPPLSGE